MSYLRLLFITGLFVMASAVNAADRLLMVRIPQTFPETMLKLQDTLTSHGYTISRVQRVDIGLTESGYLTDKYRIVFYGKADEVKLATERYPQLIPYLPLKIAIFAEGEDTLLVASSPLQLTDPQEPDMRALLEKWAKDLQLILDDMRAE